MEQETMEQETPAKLSLEDEVRHLISCLNQHLGDSASKIFGEVPVNSSLKRLHDLLQSILGDNQTGPEGSHACDIEARVALRRKDCFDALLQVVLEAPDDGEICQSLTSFGGRLLDLGFELVDEARRFIVAATTSTTARTLLYSSATSTCSPQTSTCSPPVFTFDLAQYGHASLEFSELTQPFPGIDGAQGYTVMFWMRIDRFDDACHTTLFGACDPSHTCFLLLYLDRKHHSLILQTSVTSSQPSVRFREVKFEQHMLYHVALVHRRSRQEGPGKALLYVNGILREQARCPLPKDPESMPAGKGDPLQAPTTPVRAFFGTPRDLSPSPQPQTLHSKWSLASGHLINDTLTEDLVYMHHKLGPTYRGNLQDSLGSFLTYQASTMVNLRDEQQRQDDGTPSILSEIFKSPGKPLSLETLFVLSLSPAFAGRALSVPHPQTETFSVSHPGPSSGLNPADLLVLNAAVPSKKRALEKRAGTGTCQGGVMLQNNLSVQDCSWRLAGSIPVALHFVATAKTIQGLIDATLFFFRMCTSDWRNSEATERSSGFGVLSWLLQQKVLPTGQRDALTSDRFIANISIAEDEIASQSLALLDVIVHASTAGSGSGEEAIVINPLAYRMLVIDNELWQHTGAQTQVMLYSHLLTLTCRSKHRDFNIRRLLRMRLPKRLIEILRASTVNSKACACILQILHALLDHSASSDTLRSFALYITYALRGASQISITPEHQEVAIAQQERGLRALQMLHSFLCRTERDDNVRRFTRAVTLKWLLYLLGTDDLQVFDLALSILTRVLVSSSDDILQRFEAKQGPIVLERTARSRWHSSNVWTSLLTIFFGIDGECTHVQSLEDFGQWLATGSLQPTSHTFCSFAWDAIAAMLAEGLHELQKGPAPSSDDTRSSATEAQDTFLYAVGLLSASQDHLPNFRHFLARSQGFTSLLHALHHGYARAADPRRHSGAEFPGHAPTESKGSNLGVKAPSFLVSRRQRRASEYVVLPSQDHQGHEGFDHARSLAPRATTASSLEILESRSFKAVAQILEMAAVEQVLHGKDFNGLGLFLKAPDLSPDSVAEVNSVILSRIIARVADVASTDTSIFHQSQSLINLGRFVDQCVEAIKEDWYQDKNLGLLRFLAAIIGRLDDREIRTLKNVRLCSQAVAQVRKAFVDLAMFELSLSLQKSSMHDYQDDPPTPSGASDAMYDPLTVLSQASVVALVVGDLDDRALGITQSSRSTVAALLYLVYEHITHGPNAIAYRALPLFRRIASANQVEARACFNRPAKASDMASGDSPGPAFLATMLKHDDESVLSYVDSNRASLDEAFSGGPRAAFEHLQRASDRHTREKAEQRMTRREQRLHKGHLQQLEEHHSFIEYGVGLKKWTDNIYHSETFNIARRRQDRDVNASHFAMTMQEAARSFDKLVRLQPVVPVNKWTLDDVEGHNRMRIRLCQGTGASDLNYQSKRSGRSNTLPNAAGRPSIADRRRSNTVSDPKSPQTPTAPVSSGRHDILPTVSQETSTRSAEAEGYEDLGATGMDPEDVGTADDKNRKVMRSLRQGEQVLAVYNVSRIRGLEAFEELLIVGQKALYLISDMFQRTDGEVVATPNAPLEERDPYVSMTSGRSHQRMSEPTTTAVPSAKHWSWKSVISISKRNFLLRSVALEIFLEDGRSYLLTTSTVELRDKLFSALGDQSPALQSTSATVSEPHSRRSQLLINLREPAHTITGRFANALNFGPSVTATAKWAKGELSNFQYLMLVNTLAGRTFNDLTQYPVFPWVLADYTSDELDLSNPRTFRDLSKPMGCQHPEREAAFRDRYRAFLDMSDEGTPPFNYGTHLSNAHIVSSYLIRLQPYTDAYLLLQGGSFDHADRLFFSVEKAWSSSSQANMTDVRELIPEFFYLPDMFRNINRYDFGRRDATGDLVNDVQLPPWAKGDPKIFVAKHREALESSFVSENLHQWIDLVFGFKQRGEAAVEATNVFHHLSYQGAIDLDQISDQRERMATIGIIHNFGQTPQQIFFKPHIRRDETTTTERRLHRSIGSLATRPILIFEYNDAIAEIEFNYAAKQQRLTCAGPYRAFMHPAYSMTMDWGFVDGSVRFWNPDTKKPAGIFEQLHQDDITAAIFAGTVLVTASKDCTVALWHIAPRVGPVGLHLASFLFGHRSPINALAVSSPISIIASADSTGRLILWDMNTYGLVREIETQEEVKMIKINSTNGHIAILCKTRLKLYTVNCTLILDQEVAMGAEDALHCCAFYETGGDDWIDTELIFTGHRHGIANIWKVCFDSKGHWQLLLLKQLQHAQRLHAKTEKSGAAITAICPTDTSIYTGAKNGRVFEWKVTR